MNLERSLRGAALLVFFGSCSALLTSDHQARAKNADLFEILTGFSSKETCSCAFVIEQSDEYCTSFGKFTGYDLTITIDHTAKTATSNFAGQLARTSHFTEGAGCQVDPLP